MPGAEESRDVRSRCVLCPAGCELGLAPSGPDRWRTAYPLTDDAGLCARGSVVGELLGHRRRILDPAVHEDGSRRRVGPDDALRAVLDAAGEKTLTVLLDGNLPCEQLAEAVARLDAWPAGRLCLVVEPVDRELLLGTEESGADYLRNDGLADCDGFLLVGDVFAANPLCARPVLDRHRAEPRTPIAALDPAGGAVVKFASHRVDVAPGGELAALRALAAAAGLNVDAPDVPSAAAAGAALADCERLGVLLAAECARTDNWRAIGRLAGDLAKARGGGVAVQTNGANALAAVRVEAAEGTIPLADALADESDVKVAVGCDVVGMLGRDDVAVAAAAAALPNRTTQAAGIVLPLALPGEYGGTYLLDGARPAEVGPLIDPPAGIETAAALVAALARAAGAAEPAPRTQDIVPGRVAGGDAPAETPAAEHASLVLVLARRAADGGCGALTGHASWRTSVDPLPELAMAPDDAEQAGLSNAAEVTVEADRGQLRARVRLAPEVRPGVCVLPEGLPAARALVSSELDPDHHRVVAPPRPVTVSE